MAHHDDSEYASKTNPKAVNPLQDNRMIDALKREQSRQSGINDLDLDAKTTYIEVLNEKVADSPKSFERGNELALEKARLAGIEKFSLPSFASFADVTVAPLNLPAKAEAADKGTIKR